MKRLIPTLLLKILTRRNYRLRAKGKLPDEWYWADKELVRRNIYMGS